MSIVAYTVEQGREWDTVVRSFQKYDTYWLSGYTKAFQLHGDGTPLLLYYEGKACRAINVVMLRDVAEDLHFSGMLPSERFFDLSTPYGYGGWLIEGDETTDLFSEYQVWCLKNAVICEFVRFHPLAENWIPLETTYNIVPLGQTITMDLSSPEMIWEMLSGKNRNMIRKAQKNGIRIYNGRSAALFSGFREIYNETMDQDHADPYYYFDKDFYTSILEDLSFNAQIFYAELNGKMIAASVILAANGRMNYHLSGTLHEYRHLAPSNLLLYHAALWGCANGCKAFYLGGGVGSGEDSLFQFKRSFYKGELHHFYIGKKVFDQDRYDLLVSMRKKISSGSGFFPLYRA